MATGYSEKKTGMLDSDNAPKRQGMPDSRVKKPT